MFPGQSTDSNPPADTASWSGVAFDIADRKLLIAASALQEVAVCRSIARVPAVQPWVVGLAGLRGQVLAVLDLQSYLGAEPLLRSTPATVLVFSRTDTLSLGLLCSDFVGIREYAQAPDTAAACADESLVPLVQGANADGDGQRWVIEPSRLLDDERFMQFANVENF